MNENMNPHSNQRFKARILGSGLFLSDIHLWWEKKIFKASLGNSKYLFQWCPSVFLSIWLNMLRCNFFVLLLSWLEKNSQNFSSLRNRVFVLAYTKSSIQPGGVYLHRSPQPITQVSASQHMYSKSNSVSLAQRFYTTR